MRAGPSWWLEPISGFEGLSALYYARISYTLALE